MMNWINKLRRSDRRRVARWESTGLIAYYWDGSTPAPHRVLDLSFSGFHLETSTRWRPGTLVTMTLQKSRVQADSVKADDYIIVVSRVIWSDGNGTGLEFVPREHVGEAQVPCVGSPATKQALQLFLENCEAFSKGTSVRNARRVPVFSSGGRGRMS